MGQRRAGEEKRLEALQFVRFAWLGAGLLQRGEVLGTGAEDADALGIDQLDQAFGPRMEGEPSNSTRVAPRARPETSQFHIIQPQVV